MGLYGTIDSAVVRPPARHSRRRAGWMAGWLAGCLLCAVRECRKQAVGTGQAEDAGEKKKRWQDIKVQAEEDNLLFSGRVSY